MNGCTTVFTDGRWLTTNTAHSVDDTKTFFQLQMNNEVVTRFLHSLEHVTLSISEDKEVSVYIRKHSRRDKMLDIMFLNHYESARS